jgi:hypothetical protein
MQCFYVGKKKNFSYGSTHEEIKDRDGNCIYTIDGERDLKRIYVREKTKRGKGRGLTSTRKMEHALPCML